MDCELAGVLSDTLISSNVSDSNGEPANVVDALDSIGNRIASALRQLGNADASTPMGAIEAHGKAILDAAEMVSDALRELADAVRERGSVEGC